MIKSFKSRRLQRLFEEGVTRGLPPDQIAKIENRLSTINAADRVEDINVTGYRLHALAGDLRNFYSVWITANWRIVFRFERGDAYDVDHTDYH